MLKDPEFKISLDALEAEFELARIIIEARLASGLSQDEVAARMHTTHSAIARLESGKRMPSTNTLLKLAEATGTKLHIEFRQT